MAEIIKARVWQKVDTEANWNANPLILGPGEQAFVVSSSGNVINFKVGDGTKRFSDLPWSIQYAGGQYIQIVGNVLPEPTVDVGYSLVGPGTYTFSGQADVVAPEGRLSQLLWDGTSWSLVDMGELPMQDVSGLVEKSSIVNDLITGGEDVPLSAEQGKELNILVEQKIDTDKIADNLQTNSDNFVLSARQGKILNDLIANFSGQIGSGIVGEAFPATIPISEGFGIYTVSTAGTFVNFKDVNDDPLIVSQADLDSGLVQLWGNDNVWDKHITLVDVFTPIFSDSLSDI